MTEQRARPLLRPPFPGRWGTAAGLDSPHWPLPIGTVKTMWSSVRPRDLAKLMKFSLTSGVSSLVLPVVKVASEWPANTL